MKKSSTNMTYGSFEHTHRTITLKDSAFRSASWSQNWGRPENTKYHSNMVRNIGSGPGRYFGSIVNRLKRSITNLLFSGYDLSGSPLDTRSKIIYNKHVKTISEFAKIESLACINLLFTTFEAFRKFISLH